MTTARARIGIMGCGSVFNAYAQAMQRFPNVEVTACADVSSDRTQQMARKYGIPRAYTPAELLADPQIDLVVNLTPPKAHAEVALAALQTGKHVYGEKPLGISRAEGRRILDTARARRLRVGNAPDTFLGAGQQTCRKLLDEGAIGEPVFAMAFWLSHGHEHWHPDPEFFYKTGGGPLFDMGPYYLTALINLMGPVRRVAGMTRISYPERLITSQPHAGTRVHVEVPTHVTASLEFASGAMGLLVTSFDGWNSKTPRIELHGSKGTMIAPDPNHFTGDIFLGPADSQDWQSVPLAFGVTLQSRGIGAADMVAALQADRPHRASGELSFHVLDIMESIYDSARLGRTVDVQSTSERPAAMPDVPESQLFA